MSDLKNMQMKMQIYKRVWEKKWIGEIERALLSLLDGTLTLPVNYKENGYSDADRDLLNASVPRIKNIFIFMAGAFQVYIKQEDHNSSDTVREPSRELLGKIASSPELLGRMHIIELLNPINQVFINDYIHIADRYSYGPVGKCRKGPQNP